MKLGTSLLKELNKIYPPDTLVEIAFKRYDLVLKTDDQGRAIMLFIGKKNGQGKITGERFTRRLAVDQQGHIFKDHWDNKGKV